MSAGVTPTADRLVSNRLSGAPIPVSNKMRLPSISSRKVLIDAGTPCLIPRLSISVCGSSPKRLNSISRSWALSLIWVSFMLSHTVVMLSVQAKRACSSSVAEACFCDWLHPPAHIEASSTPDTKKIPFLIIRSICLIGFSMKQK